IRHPPPSWKGWACAARATCARAPGPRASGPTTCCTACCVRSGTPDDGQAPAWRLIGEGRHPQAAAKGVLDRGGPGMTAHRAGDNRERVAASDAGSGVTAAGPPHAVTVCVDTEAQSPGALFAEDRIYAGALRRYGLAQQGR